MKKISIKICCFLLWAVSFFGVFHIQHLQKLEAQKIEQEKKELNDYDATLDTTFRADHSKKNIINILILIIENFDI